MKNKKWALANAALAGIFAAGTTAVMLSPNSARAAEYKCDGGNACKGQSKCHTASTSCGGQNGCKGKGWVNTASEQDCKTTLAKINATQKDEKTKK